jgi:hypothetical protein
LWIVREIRFGFNAAILGCTCPNIMLRGFWQTDRYFDRIANIIKEDFTFINEVPKYYSALLSDINALQSVCLHIRRTDYLDPRFNVHFIGLEYYQAACDQVAKELRHPHVFVFSDDIEWCKSHLEISFAHTFVPHDESGSNHLQLMTKCKHFIIANSTFSWWAAWLAVSTDNLVIAPRKWFHNEGQWDPNTRMFISSHDLTPARWIRI